MYLYFSIIIQSIGNKKLCYLGTINNYQIRYNENFIDNTKKKKKEKITTLFFRLYFYNN